VSKQTLNDKKNSENEHLSKYLDNAKKNLDEQSSFIKILSIMIAVFMVVILSIFILADNKAFVEKSFGKNSFITNLFAKIAKSRENKKRSGFSLFGVKKQNILFLGVDEGEPGRPFDGTRSDTIIIISIDPKTKTINTISVPRDSKVYLPGDRGVNKINSAHAIGGVKMTKETIEVTLGIRVDRYIVVHDQAVREIVDAMGGIDLYVEKDMRYNDYAGKLHINLTKGEHHLNGEEAVGYLRFRHDPLGDIGRTGRQQWFLRALAHKLKDPLFITKVPDILSTTKKYVKTDMSIYEMSQYAALIKTIDMDRIEISTLPGAPNEYGYISYWILDPKKTQETINRLIYRDTTGMDSAAPKNAGVMYSSDKEKEAQDLIDSLRAANITVKCTGTTGKTHRQFIAHSNMITNEYYNWLKKRLPDNFGNVQFVYDPVNYYCGETDFTVILSGK